MKRVMMGTLMAALMLLLLPALSGNAAAGTFQDVPEDHWAYDAVEYVYENQLMNGVGNDRFAPNESFSRGMFVTILGRLDGIDPSDYPGSSFRDVSAGIWYAPYVAWATENGIVNGYSETRFGPNDTITREQYCAIICRYFEHIGQPLSTENSYSLADWDQVSPYAQDSIRLMLGNGLIGVSETGDGSCYIMPNHATTRIESAALFAKVHKALEYGFDLTDDDSDWPSEEDEEPSDEYEDDEDYSDAYEDYEDYSDAYENYEDYSDEYDGYEEEEDDSDLYSGAEEENSGEAEEGDVEIAYFTGLGDVDPLPTTSPMYQIPVP